MAPAAAGHRSCGIATWDAAYILTALIIGVFYCGVLRAVGLAFWVLGVWGFPISFFFDRR